MNHYEEKIKNAKELIKKGDLKIAYDILDEEMKMPYVPKIYEEQFIEIMNNIRVDLIGESSVHLVPRDVALEYLTSGSEEQEAMALEILREHNLRYDVQILKNVLESWGPEKQILKAFLFEILAEQEIDVDINFNGLKLNPRINGSILENKLVEETMKLIPKYFEKNPTSESLALEEFQRFLLLTYPAVPEDPKMFAWNLSQVIKSMFEEIRLNDLQEKMKRMLQKTN